MKQVIARSIRGTYNLLKTLYMVSQILDIWLEQKDYVSWAIKPEWGKGVLIRDYYYYAKRRGRS